ncbi:oligoendopeptidase, M3 family [Caminicella sporogenes DSM 14501]|uniref:Oligoendopeptidase, M3 family n=1 Tax=Caminicella sporogenes DSM 14501 TaxID=1121266 RepID=A0A1M6Q8H2_9FIRM|nr:M3 family oligoendopeptidase [Caminicella sporogenes]RKD23612.1 oligoendopeptidase F [Caminicella sporogenes]SHK16383.1 oligoendopeptidase, M3 family [Caminicella sporogenes DSM 14501]
MLKFKDYKYERPDMERLEKQFNELLERFDNSDSFEAQDKVMKEINELRNEFETMATLVHIRHTIDTTDKFYEKENEFIDEAMPMYEGFVSKYYKSLVNSKFKSELEKKWGRQLFRLAELKLKTFSPEIIKDLQEENKLSSEYTKLRASAKIMFEGEERNLSQMVPFMQSKDRNMRKRAHEAMTEFFVENEEKFDEIYDGLVKVRDRIAKKLGYENFVQLGYARLMRSDYNPEMVANYRRQVLENIVPVATKLRERQLKRLKLDSLKYYDESLEFLTGNAIPKGDSEWILENGKRMYRELSPETDEFFTYMVERELLDLVSKKGKAGGGYCTYISKYKSPFIFSNFNGTSGDVDVLTHEAGHAFQVYSSREYEVPEYNWPTLEACEIHSMSMEFFAWPWMKLFFKEDEFKYKFAHLSGALLFIPYGVTVDEFQHWVYENPQATPEERKRAWRDIEKKYLPHRDYADNDFLNRGGYWFRQGHIFNNPFYYIDYTLAQVCALQFWIKSMENRDKAWNDYLRLCRAGGSKSFLELVELADLRNPFEDGCIKSVIGPVEDWLDSIDDKNL